MSHQRKSKDDTARLTSTGRHWAIASPASPFSYFTNRKSAPFCSDGANCYPGASDSPELRLSAHFSLLAPELLHAPENLRPSCSHGRMLPSIGTAHEALQRNAQPGLPLNLMTPCPSLSH
jgi:hypothetical protein